MSSACCFNTQWLKLTNERVQWDALKCLRTQRTKHILWAYQTTYKSSSDNEVKRGKKNWKSSMSVHCINTSHIRHSQSFEWKWQLFSGDISLIWIEPEKTHTKTHKISIVLPRCFCGCSRGAVMSRPSIHMQNVFQMCSSLNFCHEERWRLFSEWTNQWSQKKREKRTEQKTQTTDRAKDISTANKLLTSFVHYTLSLEQRTT